MAYKNLQHFIHALQDAGELTTINEFVSPRLEITEITDRISKHGGKALLFTNNGTAFPLLINAMGSEKRMCLALGVNSLDQAGDDIRALLDGLMNTSGGIMGKLRMLPTLGKVASWMPKVMKGKGACQQVVMSAPDLSKLPVLTCWPHDGGPFITLPAVHTKDPVTGTRNLGMYRMQLFGNELTGMHWHLHKNSARHYQEYKRLGLKMPVAIALGGDPSCIYAASAPLPDNIDEYMLAGFLRKKKVELVKCLTCELEVPAESDFIIEGYVDPAEELILEGPFGDHTGFYSLADYYPKFHVTCITHRIDAVYPTTIVGIPPQEDAWMGRATERIFLAPIRLSMIPELIDIHMPAEGVFHNIVIARIHKTYAGQAIKVMNALWGAGQMMFNKVLIIINRDIDLKDYFNILQVISETVNIPSDILISKGPSDVLDHSSAQFAFGGKLGIDATDKLSVEMPAKMQITRSSTIPYSEIMSFDGVSHCNTKYVEQGLLVIAIDKAICGQVSHFHNRLITASVLQGLRFVVYVDKQVGAENMADVAWQVANNCDPQRDCFMNKSYSVNQDQFLAIDGTRKTDHLDGFKREWPNIITMDAATIHAIDDKWDRLGLGAFIPSPSLHYSTLTLPGGAAVEMPEADK
ncbi:MAG TPA: menaquinone biosynthesis decarboxylase [Bacteroidales bacterium]